MTYLDTEVWIETRFDGTHRWPSAPDAVSHLNNRHRHTFVVRVNIDVGHDDREVEFFLLKKFVDQYLDATFERDLDDAYVLDTMSCEAIARSICRALIVEYGNHRDITVDVSEDGLRGGIVYWSGEA